MIPVLRTLDHEGVRTPLGLATGARDELGLARLVAQTARTRAGASEPRPSIDLRTLTSDRVADGGVGA